ncbi:MAG: hypothetical protein JKY37_27050, partial [Nannocystaceae bacterium]|nr:hypothetical protein [Nannocystaceae bacterium]
MTITPRSPARVSLRLGDTSFAMNAMRLLAAVVRSVTRSVSGTLAVGLLWLALPLVSVHGAPTTTTTPRAPESLVEPLVELDWDNYRALREDLDRVEAEAAAPHVAFRQVTLVPRPSGDPPGLDVRGTWQIRADRSGFIAGLLAGPMVEVERVTIDGIAAPLVRTPAGSLLLAYVKADATLRLDGFVAAPIDGDGGEFSLTLLPAVRGSLRIEHPTHLLEATSQPESGGVLRSERVLWSGAAALQLRIRKPGTGEKAQGTLAVAHAGLGITIGEGDVSIHARVIWAMRRGSTKALAVRVTGLGDDLSVEGTDVAQWSRNGDTIDIALSAPVSTRTAIELRWTRPLRDATEASFAVPRIEPLNAFRTDASLQLARDGELEVVPDLATWNAVAASALPKWGRGLVQGTPTAAYQRSMATGDLGTLALLRFVPVPGPAAVVDVAAYTIALTEQGRLLALAKYQIRNERAAFLRITPPKGTTIIGARIAGETALPGRAQDGTWLIPLKRSLETVDGLLSFPVELTLLGDSEAWTRRERRTLTLPRLDAPIAVSRITVYLPPRYRNRFGPGDGGVVEDFTEGQGITYGLGLGAEKTAQADALLQQAVDEYRNNEFEAAQGKLDALGDLGANNANVDRLQANVYLVTGSGNSSADAATKNETALVRRVKDQAKARAADEFERQRTLEEEAENLARSGDYAGAEQAFAQAIELGDKLQNLEQKESVETQTRNSGLKGKLSAVTVAKKRKTKIARRGRKRNTRKKRSYGGPRRSVSNASAVTPTSAQDGAYVLDLGTIETDGEETEGMDANNRDDRATLTETIALEPDSDSEDEG